MTIPSYLRLKGDTVIWVIFFLLCIISLLAVFSAGSTLSYSRGGDFWHHIKAHGMFLVAGVIICMITHDIPCNYFKFVPFFAWPLSLVLVLVVWGQDIVTNGAARWLTIGGMRFQPSELAKGAMVLTIALILSILQDSKGAQKSAMKYILWASLLLIVPIAAENASTGALMLLVMLVMMILGRVPWKQIGKLALVGFAGVAFFVMMMIVMPKDNEAAIYRAPVVGKVLHRFPTWRERFTNSSMEITANPDSFVVTDENRQQVHARIAIATCNMGVGKRPGNSVERDFLSQAYSDFIYAIIVEEYGFAGAIVIVVLYLILLYRTGLLASKCGKNFPALAAMGLAVMMVFQALLNMMVAVGLFPVTGQTLPMISRGGTSIIITSVYFGIILSISRYAHARQSQLDKNLIEDPADAVAVHYTDTDEVQ